MAANISHFGELAQNHLYMTEGTAELVHGIDDARKGTILKLADPMDICFAVRHNVVVALLLHDNIEHMLVGSILFNLLLGL